jgi:DNA-binding SARP family transcriptional activator
MTASTSDQKLLDGVSPDMRSAYETQLRAVNAYIRDADAYVKRNPDDEDARQHLMDAYEQREMLYQMALDHVQ